MSKTVQRVSRAVEESKNTSQKKWNKLDVYLGERKTHGSDVKTVFRYAKVQREVIQVIL